MRNEPKEGIEANAINRIYTNRTVNPVGNVVRVNPYREQERNPGGAGQQFSGLLKTNMEKKQDRQENKKRANKDKLRLMGGLNQYDRYAVEYCYLLSNEMDYRV